MTSFPDGNSSQITHAIMHLHNRTRLGYGMYAHE